MLRPAPRALAAAALAVLAACSSDPTEDLKSPSPDRRAAAVARLARAGDERDVPILLVASQDPSPLVRRAAAQALASRGDGRSLEALGSMVLDPEAAVALAATRALGETGRRGPARDAREAEGLQRRAREQLALAYASAGPGIRVEIAEALDALGTSLREAVEAEARRLWERNARALELGSHAERVGAAEELGRSGRAEAVRRLLPLADREEDPRLAAAAARGLGASGDASARPALEELLAAPDVRLAEAAAAALGSLADPGAAEALADEGGAGSARLAAAATAALAAMPQAPEVVVALCEVALRTVDPRVAERAARHVREREGTCPERALAARLGRRGAETAAGLAVLGALGLGGARLEVPAQRALAILQSRGGDAGLRAAAARALGRAGWAPAGPALLQRGQALAARVAEARRKWVPTSLGAEGPKVAIDPAQVAARPPPRPSGGEDGRLLPEWTEDVDPDDAEELAAVAVALAALRAEGAAALAASLASDPDEVVRAAAAEAAVLLGNRGRAEAALADPSERVRLAAEAALPRLGAAAAPALAAAAARTPPPSREEQEALAQALGDTGAAAAVPALAALAEGPAAPAAAAALGRLGVEGAAKPLAELLERGQTLGRLEAVEALGALGFAGAGPQLARELASDRPEVRAAAARSLGRLRFEGASAALEALRSDYYVAVRRAAVEALARLPAGTGRR